MKTFLVRLTNLSPWLMNKVSEESMLQMRDKTKKKAATASKLSPEEEAAKKVYEINNKPVLPNHVLIACLCNAGRMIRLDGKKQVSTAKSSILPGVLTILDETLWLRKCDGKDFSKWGIAEWKYDMRFGRNPNGEQGVVIVRPRFDNCGTEFKIQIDDEFMPESTYRELFDKAGNFFGLFDFRPERKGPFGRFRVDIWKEIK